MGNRTGSGLHTVEVAHSYHGLLLCDVQAAHTLAQGLRDTDPPLHQHLVESPAGTPIDHLDGGRSRLPRGRDIQQRLAGLRVLLWDEVRQVLVPAARSSLLLSLALTLPKKSHKNKQNVINWYWH